MADRRETALAEIERRVGKAEHKASVCEEYGAADALAWWRWVLAALRNHKATLERHEGIEPRRVFTGISSTPTALLVTACHWCRRDYPCPDALGVLNIYAPEATP